MITNLFPFRDLLHTSLAQEGLPFPDTFSSGYAEVLCVCVWQWETTQISAWLTEKGWYHIWWWDEIDGEGSKVLRKERGVEWVKGMVVVLLFLNVHGLPFPQRVQINPEHPEHPWDAFLEWGQGDRGADIFISKDLRMLRTWARTNEGYLPVNPEECLRIARQC